MIFARIAVVAYPLLLFCITSVAQKKLELDGFVRGYEGKVKLILNEIKSNHEADMDNEEELFMIDGRFKIEREVTEPTLLSIRIRPELTEDFDPRSFESTFIWVTNRKMTLTGEKGLFEYSEVSGYSLAEEGSRMNASIQHRLVELSERIDSLSLLKTKAAVSEYNELTAIPSIYWKNRFRLDYCLQNPQSFITAYEYSWFVKWLPEMVPKSHTEVFYSALSDELKQSIPGRQIKHYLDHVAVNARLRVGDRVYDFSLPDSAGHLTSLRDFEGKMVLLDFWASDCAPCRKEHAVYGKIYDEFKDQGFEIISVSQDRKKESWERAMVKDNMSWISLWDEDMHVSKYTYLVSAIPDNYLIDQKGYVIAVGVRGRELNKHLTEQQGN